GSFILLVIGVYSTVIHAVSTFDLAIIVVVGIGIACGIVTMSKIIHYFLLHFHHATFAIIIGLVIGSIYVIFPGWSMSVGQLMASVIVFIIGFFTAMALGRVEY